MNCQLPRLPAPEDLPRSAKAARKFIQSHTHMQPFVLNKKKFLRSALQALPYFRKNRKISIKMESSAIECIVKVPSYVLSRDFREEIWCWHSRFLNKPHEKSKLAEGNLYQAIDEHFVWKNYFRTNCMEAFCFRSVEQASTVVQKQRNTRRGFVFVDIFTIRTLVLMRV